MKVVSTDNFGMAGEMPGRDERLVCAIDEQSKGEFVVKALNSYYGGDMAPRYFKIVADDYVLRVFEP